MNKFSLGVLSGALLLASGPALAAEFTAEMFCADEVGTGMLLDKNTPKKPGSLTLVARMIPGKNAGRNGFYVYRDDAAYFLQIPPNAKPHVDEEFPNASPATFLWAKIPRGTGGVDEFQFTIQDGEISGYSDKIGYKIGRKEWPDSKGVFDKHMVTSTAVDAIGDESRSAILEAIRKDIPKVADRYVERVARYEKKLARLNADGRARMNPRVYESELRSLQREVPAAAPLIAALEACQSVQGGKLRTEIGEAIARIKEKVPSATPALSGSKRGSQSGAQ